MNVHPSAPTDPDAFLRWNLGREGKRELVNGKIVEMIGATWGHARKVRQLARVLEDSLDPARFEVATNDIGVATSAGVRYPDLLVDRAGNDPRILAATAPVLIVEVLSPSSLAIDIVEKAAEYTGLPTLQAYLVLSQEEVRAWLWLREADGWTGPKSVVERDGVIAIPSISLNLSLGRLYRT